MSRKHVAYRPVHTSSEAEQSAGRSQARGYRMGNYVYFFGNHLPAKPSPQVMAKPEDLFKKLFARIHAQSHFRFRKMVCTRRLSLF